MGACMNLLEKIQISIGVWVVVDWWTLGPYWMEWVEGYIRVLSPSPAPRRSLHEVWRTLLHFISVA